MQKIINVLALASTAVSIAVVGTGAYVYVNKDSIIESVTEKALGSLGGLGGGLGGDLPIGAPDLSTPTQMSLNCAILALPLNCPNEVFKPSV